jgi:GntR family transcriptional repressor for pyruvate dehydrogenase complex
VEHELPYRAVAPPQRQRLSDSIAEQVERLIVEGTLGPGHALPAERVLAQQFGVSRPSVREALLRLEARGLLKVARGGGFAVTDVTAPTITNPLVHLLQRHPAAEQDVLELRHGLELVAAQFAAQRATKSDHAQLRHAFEQMAKPAATHDALAAAQHDAEFHLAIAEASHNVALIHVMHGLHNLLRTSMRHAWDVMYKEHGSTHLLHEQHRALLDAVLNGDPQSAREAAHLHLSFVRQSLLQHAPPPAAPARAKKAASAAPRARASRGG